MLVPGSANPLLLRTVAAAATGVSRSIRLNAPDSAYLSRTPASAGNRKTWTWSAWTKRNKLGTGQQFLTCSTSGYSTWSILGFNANDTLSVWFQAGSNPNLQSTAVYRDCSAWMHVLINCDTTQATAANRGAIYVNGVKVTTFNFETYPSQNADTDFNTTYAHDIGRQSTGAYYCDLMLADVYWIDGQALTPSSFTETDATTGQLVKKAYTGSYGTNGFHLEFADNSASTAAALGKDTSGNGNNWTPNNLSVTAGAGNDSLVDVPTNGAQTDTGVGGEVRGNYCTLNPLDKGSNVTLTNGNLDVSTNSTWNSVRATFGITSGKWYWEYTMSAAGYTMVGIGTTAVSLAGYIGQSASGYAFYSLNGNKWNNGTAASYGNSFTTNDVVGVAFDADSGKIWFSKNGTWQASGDPAAGTNAAYTSIPSSTYFPTISQDNSLPASTGGTLNAGARPFAYTAPSGFKALCTANLPAPLVTKPSTVFDTLLWTGNGSARSITGLGFNPDLVWIKSRSAATDHELTDSVRGTTKSLSSNLTAAEATDTGGLTAFNSDGFSLGTDTKYNNNAATYAGWCWDAGTSTVTNTQGSITSSVRANPTAGFSVITATTTNTSSQTFGHGLGVVPVFHIIKLRNGTDEWYVYHSSIGATQYLKLNATTAASTSSALYANTAPTSSVITLGSGWNSTSYNIVCYAFAPVVGYSSFGSYTGNGSSDGPFVYTGFRPRWLMIKQTNASGNDWYIWDSARESYNLAGKSLQANTANAEPSIGGPYSATLDILSNGFKPRDSGAGSNGSSSTYVYAAFAESPFNYSRAR